MSDMGFRLLGPLEVTEPGRTHPLGGIKQRSLLAILLLHAGEVVASDRLIAELWGDAADLALEGLSAYAAPGSSGPPALVIGYGRPPEPAYTRGASPARRDARY